MNLLTIPIRNLKRRPMRTFLLLLVFTLGVTSVVALRHVSGVVSHGLERKLAAFGANILVAPRTETLSVSYGGFSLGELIVDMQYLDEEEITSRIQSIGYRDRISTIAPKLVEMARLDGRTVGVIGVRFDRERLMKSYWAFRGTYPSEPDQLLIGSRTAETLGLEVGDQVELLGGTFNVSAILYETGGDEDGVIHMNMVRLQQLTGREGSVSFFEVAALCADCPIEDIVSQIEEALPDVDITTLRNVVKQRMLSVTFVSRLVMAVGVVILLASCSMLGLSMLSSVNERKKEIGILRSLGYTRSRIFLVFCLEALFVGVLAGIAGNLGGFGASLKVVELLDIGAETTISLDWLGLTAMVAAVCLLSVLSAALPAWKAARIEPSQALISL